MAKTEESLTAEHHEARKQEHEAKIKAFFEMIAREYSEGRAHF